VSCRLLRKEPFFRVTPRGASPPSRSPFETPQPCGKAEIYSCPPRVFFLSCSRQIFGCSIFVPSPSLLSARSQIPHCDHLFFPSYRFAMRLFSKSFVNCTSPLLSPLFAVVSDALLKNPCNLLQIIAKSRPFSPLIPTIGFSPFNLPLLFQPLPVGRSPLFFLQASPALSSSAKSVYSSPGLLRSSSRPYLIVPTHARLHPST